MVTHAVDGDGDDDDDDALELCFVSSSVSVGAVEMVPLVCRSVPLFNSPWLTGILESLSASQYGLNCQQIMVGSCDIMLLLHVQKSVVYEHVY